jgi:hypothetical protein
MNPAKYAQPNRRTRSIASSCPANLPVAIDGDNAPTATARMLALQTKIQRSFTINFALYISFCPGRHGRNPRFSGHERRKT